MKKIILRNHLFNKLFRSTLGKIDRTTWLQETLAPYCTLDELKQLPFYRPEEFVSPSIIDQIANDVVEEHTRKVGMLSSGATLLARASLNLSIPIDLSLYYTHLMAMSMKLSYLYGWDSSFFGGELTEETSTRIMLLMSYAYGSMESKEILLDQACADIPYYTTEMQKRNLSIPKPVARRAASTFALQVVKGVIFGKIVRKYPLLGSLASGGMSYANFHKQSIRIRNLLREIMYTRLNYEL